MIGDWRGWPLASMASLVYVVILSVDPKGKRRRYVLDSRILYVAYCIAVTS